jgi:hypothetical protein
MKSPIKRKFLTAVWRMEPGNAFLTQIAELIPDEELPPVVGMAAFEFVSTIGLLRQTWRTRRTINSQLK